jgi:hypothetical protein
MQNPKEKSRIERLAALKNIKSPPPRKNIAFIRVIKELLKQIFHVKMVFCVLQL